MSDFSYKKIMKNIKFDIAFPVLLFVWKIDQLNYEYESFLKYLLLSCFHLIFLNYI